MEGLTKMDNSFTTLATTNSSIKKRSGTHAPPSFCKKIARFGNNGKKRRDVVKSVFLEQNKPPEKKTAITDLANNLKALVCEGESISAGHYICYYKRGETWYYSSGTRIHKSSAFEATSQPAYLLFYEKCAEKEF